MTGFRLVTLNLLNYPESWPQRVPLVARQLAALAPEIVALQEVGIPDKQTDALRTALAAATELPYDVRGCEMYRPDGWSEGLATLTSFPITAHDSLDVDGEGRICLWTRIALPEGRLLDLYNLHLNPHRPDVRSAQVAAILEWSAAHPGATTRLICGDFNAIPTGRTIPKLTEAGLASAHALHHGTEPERTFPTPLRPDVYERLDGRCFDYIFFDPAQLTVRDSRVTLDQPDPTNPALYPSDHAGLVAYLAWR